MVKTIGTEHVVYQFSRFSEPCAEIEPGEAVQFETMDAANNRYRTVADALALRTPLERSNPATGPVFVRGAEPGDSLVVSIDEIRVGPVGYNRLLPGRGAVTEGFLGPHANIIEIRKDVVYFNDRIRFAARPMIGTIGTAPEGEPVLTFLPGPHGGNMDVNETRVGAKVYLPVAVRGALLALGDVHASMGDGELTGGGIDVPAEVLVRVDLVKNRRWPRPWIATPVNWVTYGHGRTLEQAVRLAAGDMIDLLSEKLEISREESFQLIGARGDVHLGQAAQLPLDMTAYLVMEKLGTSDELVNEKRMNVGRA